MLGQKKSPRRQVPDAEGFLPVRAILRSRPDESGRCVLHTHYSRTNRAGHLVERGLGLGADRADGGQAHDDDQGQHHRVLDRGRSIFAKRGNVALSEQATSWVFLHSSLSSACRSRPELTNCFGFRRVKRRLLSKPASACDSPSGSQFSNNKPLPRRLPKSMLFTLSAARLPPEIIRRPLALRAGLATGLPLSRMKRLQAFMTQESRRSDKLIQHASGGETPRRGRLAAAPLRLTLSRSHLYMNLCHFRVCQIGDLRKSSRIVKILPWRRRR